MIPGLEALERLRDGNARFVAGEHAADSLTSRERQKQLLAGQDPIAVILGCSDSRMPAEFVFDQDLGSLFVVRVAGNIAAPPQVGSVEYAVEQLGVRLVVVVGHTCCGAIYAAFDHLRNPAQRCAPGLEAVLREIEPAIAPVLETASECDHEELVRRAVRANARAAVARLKDTSPAIERLARQDGLILVAAECSLDTGTVDFFEFFSETAPGDRTLRRTDSPMDRT